MHGEYSGGTSQVEGSVGIVVFAVQSGPDCGETEASDRHFLLMGHLDPLLDVQAVVPGNIEISSTRTLYHLDKVVYVS